MPPVGFEPTISAEERPQSHALDRAATGAGYVHRWGRYEVLEEKYSSRRLVNISLHGVRCKKADIVTVTGRRTANIT